MKKRHYIIGKLIELETDHKPLVPLLSKTSLDSLPPRVLRFRLRLARFHYTIAHVPGKFLYTADALSCAPVFYNSPITEEEKDSCSIHALATVLPAKQDRLDEYKCAQKHDPVCSKLRDFCRQGWPSKHQIKGDLKGYWSVRGELTLVEDMLLSGNRILVPQKL